MNPRDRQPPPPPPSHAPGTDADDASEWEPLPGGPALGANGQLTHTPPPRLETPPRPPQVDRVPEAPLTIESPAEAAAAPPSGLDVPVSGLELEERAPRPESTWEPEPAGRPRRPRRWVGLLVALGVVAALVGGGLSLWPRLRWEAKRAANGGAAPMLSIQSQPDGARVLVDGVVVGTTPMVMDNVYPERPIPVQLKLRGYRPWTGTFTGGETSTLDVRLQR